ncbi:hypothetical protein BDZ97DRAFT_1812837 [Flammula alnicola]|nr:hypothetical protein BDZ97DRAFT_1812837 [Flammula alnicola]
MSDSEEVEYEVESIGVAKVEAASRAKRSKLTWKYLVRWKGYSPADDTWEPIESFNGSEHIVQAFWERAHTDGRDFNNMSLFNVGETFRPIGPPRRKKSKGKSTNDAQTTPPSNEPPQQGPSKPESTTKTSEKRRHISPDVIEISDSDRPKKRLRDNASPPFKSSSSTQRTKELRTRPEDKVPLISASALSNKQKKLRVPSSPEVIPDSDEETNGPNALRMHYASPEYPSTKSPKAQENPFKPQESPTIIQDVPNSDIDQLFEEDPARRIPAHRVRQANPRVKLVDDPNLSTIEGTIATKARAVERANAGSSSSIPVQSSSTQKTRPKPGPGRSSTGLMQKNKSSLLTAEKGALKSVKGKYVASKSSTAKTSTSQGPNSMEVDPVVNKSPPSAEELLQLAGLDAKAAEALPDFEDEAVEQNNEVPKTHANSANPVDQSSTPNEKDKEHSSHQESLDLAKDKLFPVQTPVVPATLSTTWKQSTIFGPLGLGSETKVEQPTSSRLFLNLDTSVAIPILVADAPQSTRTLFNEKMGTKQVPGKFYRMDAALSLLATVRSAGASAVVTVCEDATTEEKGNFALFHDRLEAGDIFVAVAGIQILVFCSSSNALLSSRLNAPPSLLNQRGTVLVSQVDVENYSGYADAAANADDRRWSQYIAAK